MLRGAGVFRISAQRLRGNEQDEGTERLRGALAWATSPFGEASHPRAHVPCLLSPVSCPLPLVACLPFSPHPAHGLSASVLNPYTTRVATHAAPARTTRCTRTGACMSERRAVPVVVSRCSVQGPWPVPAAKPAVRWATGAWSASASSEACSRAHVCTVCRLAIALASLAGTSVRTAACKPPEASRPNRTLGAYGHCTARARSPGTSLALSSAIASSEACGVRGSSGPACELTTLATAGAGALATSED